MRKIHIPEDVDYKGLEKVIEQSADAFNTALADPTKSPESLQKALATFVNDCVMVGYLKGLKEGHKESLKEQSLTAKGDL